MAVRYFDANGTTAGFGTMTGSWTGSLWSTSSAGTATPATYTFTNADEAVFGVTGTSATAGTVTIPTGTTVTLNKITNANVAALQTLTFAGTGALTLAGTTPTITVNSAGGLSIAAPTSGTVGVTKAGTGNLFFTGATSGLSGTVTLSDGLFLLQPTSTPYTAFSSSPATSIVLNGGVFVPRPNVASGAITINGTFTGAARLQHNSDLGYNTSTTLTGTVVGLASVQSNGGSGTATVNLIDFPYSTAIVAADSTLASTINVAQGANQSVATALQFSQATTSAVTLSLNINNSSYTLTTSGGIARTDAQAATLTATFGGTGTLVVNGNAANSSANPVSLTKSSTGTLVLNGDNSLFRDNSVTISASGGALRIGHASALGTGSGAVTVNSSSAFELTSDITFARPVTSSGTVRNVSGSNTLSSTVSLAGTTVIEATAGTLTLSNTISGASAVTFGSASTGTATVRLTGTNSFSANPSLAAGTVSVNALAASGTNSPLGSGSSITFPSGSAATLTVSGGTTLASTNRGLSLTSATPTFTSSNTSADFPVVLSGTVTPSGTNTVSLAGTNTGYNTFAGVLGGSDAFAKSGDSRWVVTGNNDLSGTTNVTGGTLVASNATTPTTSKKLGGTVVVSAGAKIQLSSDNGQAGRCAYTTLRLNGSAGNPAKIRAGGSGVSPTVYLDGNLVMPASGSVTWDLSAEVFKTPGTYTLFVFSASGVATNWGAATLTASGLATGRSAAFSYNSGASPKTVTVVIS